MVLPPDTTESFPDAVLATPPDTVEINPDALLPRPPDTVEKFPVAPAIEEVPFEKLKSIAFCPILP